MQGEFQDRLIEFRKAVSSNATAFARSIGQSQPAYANYEIGKRKPAFEILEKMARVHSVNLNWLLTGEGEMFNLPPSLKIRKKLQENKIKNFGKKLNKLQTENDLSIPEAAEILEISEDDFVDFCLNRKEPNLEIILKAINTFDVDFEYFVG